MHEYQKLKHEIVKVLLSYGFIEVASDVHLDSDGSIHSIYANGVSRFMIAWNGEDGYGSVESWQNEAWSMLKPIVPESPENEFYAKVNSLCNQLKVYLSCI